MAAAIPFIMAGGAVAQGVSQKNAADNNALIQGYEAKTASSQGYVAEATQRRMGAQTIGKELTAAGQAGGGYGGSTGRSIAQSAVNAEMDDLNVRYRAGIQNWGYTTQAGFTKQEGNDALATSFARAGSGLLSGYSKGYTADDLG